jgi:hypothetical protein
VKNPCHQSLDGLQDERQRHGHSEDPKGRRRCGASKVVAGQQPRRADDDRRHRQPVSGLDHLCSARADLVGRAGEATLQGPCEVSEEAADEQRQAGREHEECDRARERPGEIDPTGKPADCGDHYQARHHMGRGANKATGP